MAYAYGSAVNGYWKAYLDYSVSVTSTTYSVTCVVGMQTLKSYLSRNAQATLGGTDQTSSTQTSTSIGGSAGYYPLITSTTYTWSRTSTNDDKTITFSFKTVGGTIAPGTSSGTLAITVPKLEDPPTFNASVTSSAPYYAGYSTYSVAVSNLSAKQGASISSVVLEIGAQTDTGTTNKTYSIALNQGGAFTPTITVTDSYGRETVETFSAINVQTYTAPTCSFTVARVNSGGSPDDEGTYALLEVTLTFADVMATAQAPSVVITDDAGTQSTPTVTWYTSSALSTQVTWANVSSGDTVYGLFSGVSTQHSYTVAVRPRDNKSTGGMFTQTLGAAFYTIDFLAGGHGIAFGQPATTTGFYCAMDMYLRGERVPTFYITTTTPTSADGENGDVWFVYTP